MVALLLLTSISPTVAAEAFTDVPIALPAVFNAVWWVLCPCAVDGMSVTSHAVVLAVFPG